MQEERGNNLANCTTSKVFLAFIYVILMITRKRIVNQMSNKIVMRKLWKPAHTNKISLSSFCDSEHWSFCDFNRRRSHCHCHRMSDSEYDDSVLWQHMLTSAACSGAKRRTDQWKRNIWQALRGVDKGMFLMKCTFFNIFRWTPKFGS